tara:strand:+ start:2781 stop:4214 length:1434 start_codon:yes stop_codon:yes gene_type:complete
MEQMLPSSINYLDVLPKAIPSEKTRKRFFSSNGRTFGPDATIKIDLESSRMFLDPSNCFLDFNFVNSTGQGCGLDFGGAYNFIKNFRIHQKGNEILRMNNVNRLMNAIILPATDNMAVRGNQSITGQQRFGTNRAAGTLNTVETGPNTNGDLLLASAHMANNSIGNNTGVRLTMPLIGGLFSQVGEQKLLPLPLLDGPIELYFDLCDREDPCCWAANPGNWVIEDVSVVADLVEVPRDVIGFMKELQMAHGGSLAIQAQAYEHNSGNLTAGQTGTQTINIPSRKRSIKSVYWAGSSNDYSVAGVGTRGTTFNLSYAGQLCLSSYFIRAGALVMPQPAVICSNNPNVVGNSEYRKGEQFMEFKKSLGHLGHGIGTGILTTFNYANSDGDNSDGAAGQQSPVSNTPCQFSPYGFNLDAYQNEAIKAGLDTQTLSLEMQLNLEVSDDGGVVFAENQLVDIFTLYDVQYYINADGTITFED